MSGDRAQISAICHGELPFHNPIGAARVDEALAHARLEPGARMLDVGCGAGELLVRAADRHGVTGLGVDVAAVQIDAARVRAARRVPQAGLRFEAADAGSLLAGDPGGYDLVACIGSMHALEDGLGALARLARPGGCVLVGDGFWRRAPQPEFLEALGGATEDELPRFEGLVRAGETAGLEAAYVAVATDEEWDRYEWTLISNGLAWAARRPGDPLAGAVAAWARRARERVLAPGGRDTLGFALVLHTRA